MSWLGFRGQGHVS